MRLLQFVPATWDIISFLTNGKNITQVIGGALISLIGIICVVVSVVFFAMKLLSEQSRKSWFLIIGLLIFGGVCLTGGILLFVNIASGAQTTVDQLGGGLILLGLGA
ncbi:MAG TPA: hypothetical protein VFU07_05220 [Candidatus Lumbricidophila sp.]|nr:hypothetical protein [Candidatus Lumbricidophila sp.]